MKTSEILTVYGRDFVRFYNALKKLGKPRRDGVFEVDKKKLIEKLETNDETT